MIYQSTKDLSRYLVNNGMLSENRRLIRCLNNRNENIILGVNDTDYNISVLVEKLNIPNYVNSKLNTVVKIQKSN